ncbi:putative exocyst complex component 5 [Apostichopus japonicus]|uniref:Exocyst complex component 5 n=1 Tax=Stichopus japonicus TaxID=307972 RepID=A0A2G8KWZ3_STIJA|nr:putative exocyst complex component 5 [Apostichopus japonicus]
MSSLRDFENPEFDSQQYVEQLAWRVMGGDRKEGPTMFDPHKMLESFQYSIEQLKKMSERMDDKIKRLEDDLQSETKAHSQRISQLQDSNKTAVAHFQKLDDRINSVATKVVHLGDQLEGVNTPRARDDEAQKLIKYFAKFTEEGPLVDELFNDPFQIQDAADVIQKLQLISQELPQDQFEKPKRRIQEKYNKIEEDLIAEFRAAYRSGDKGRMKELASILTHFKGYNRCIDAFIEESQSHAYIISDICEDLLPICEMANELVHEVFSSPESVMGRFVLNLYESKLQEYVMQTLRAENDSEMYLKLLHRLYRRTRSLTEELSTYKLGSDAHLLSRLTKHIFGTYLDTYISKEETYLAEKMNEYLDMYYKGHNHLKKPVPTGDRLQEFQAFLTKTPLNIGTSSQQVDYNGETFLSQEVAINILNESKQAFNRCQLLSGESSLADNAQRIFEVLMKYLCDEHINYALDLGIHILPLLEPRVPPECYFFETIGQANAIFHLLERQFGDVLVTLIRLVNDFGGNSADTKETLSVSNYLPKFNLASDWFRRRRGRRRGIPAQHSACVDKKVQVMQNMEHKIQNGLDRLLTSIVGYIKYVLATEQKKNDFRPEGEETEMAQFSPNFTYNPRGAMLVICDVNEYRRMVKSFQIPMVNSLFEMLHSLCNLLVVNSENLKMIINGEQLASIEKSVIMSFIQLRSDFKTAKIAQQLR